VTVPVSIDARIFRDFALFDGFFRQHRWRPLALFTGILLISAFVCFLMRNRAEQAAFLGIVLALIGTGLPVAYVLSFLSSIRTRAKRCGLPQTATHIPSRSANRTALRLRLEKNASSTAGRIFLLSISPPRHLPLRSCQQSLPAAGRTGARRRKTALGSF
jgi:hypothetical protein